ncbi:hypothetical protein ANN_13767 [Periplaneta americana]|uniref:Zinc finger PHD-type domain-containing protein n=1 Tax=Periplaneta americana TaxID=6978 RepID=A0ABQ8SUF7_PERAM|nr:hypothetical protein ANN_13767 [Periplaneta americana]
MGFIREEKKINKLMFGDIFKSSWLKVATPAIAESGFLSTVVYPFNENPVSQREFLPGGSSAQHENLPEIQTLALSASPVDNNDESPNSSALFHDLIPSPHKSTPKSSANNSAKGKTNKRIQNQSTSSSSPCESSESSEEEDNNTSCGLCKIKYSDALSVRLGDWIQCQVKGREWYHEKCVGAEGRKKFVCGRCVVLK